MANECGYECNCNDYEVCASCRQSARQSYAALNCKGKQDADEFFGHSSPAKPCGFNHNGTCNDTGNGLYR